MIKKVIKFQDFDGNEVTEEHYFHLSKAELIEMELAEEGGMAAKLEAIVEANSGAQIIKTFKDMISASYGLRDPTNPTRFTKDPKVTLDFMTSLAFDALFQELLTDPMAAAVFANGLVPSDLADNDVVKKAFAEANLPIPVEASVGMKSGMIPAPYRIEEDKHSGLKRPRDEKDVLLPWAFREPTRREAELMTKEQLQDVFVRRGSGWVATEAPL